jgi:hypothetical protein
MTTQYTATDHGGRKASIAVRVTDLGGVHAVVTGAWIGLYRAPESFDETTFDNNLLPSYPNFVVRQTDSNGCTTFDGLDEGVYLSAYLHSPRTDTKCVRAQAGCITNICLEPVINASVTTVLKSNDCNTIDCRTAQQGDHFESTIHYAEGLNAKIIRPSGSISLPADGSAATSSTMLTRLGPTDLSWSIQLPMLTTAAALVPNGQSSSAELRVGNLIDVGPRLPNPVSGNLGVSLTRTETEATSDLPLWVAVRNGTEALSFNNYQRFINLLFCPDTPPAELSPTGSMLTPGSIRGGIAFPAHVYGKLRHKRFLPFTDSDSYRVLKAATEAFVMVNCAVLSSPDAFHPSDDNAYLDRRDLPLVDDFSGVFNNQYLERLDNLGILPYLALIRRKLPDIPITHLNQDDASLCVGFVQEKLVNPCLIELIWSYWNEEGMVVQTMNAVTRRFQNVRSPATPDPLANLEIDPLRPLNNLIWGYTQDEQHRLTVNRRNYEYDHHYGLRLQGRAVEAFRPADTRSQFLEAFHRLLRLCTAFFKQDDDTTIKADAFPALNALKEVHLVMSQGAHNQFGDLPSTARIEMLMQQWLLGRPEFREFLPTRIMVAYPEPWMDRVDAMKKLQGWTDTSVMHFRNLAIFGEQLLLTIRYGAWSEVYEPTQAFNWTRFWRPQIQGYIHAYRAATGVDLSAETGDATADATLPSLLLQNRLAVQRRSVSGEIAGAVLPQLPPQNRLAVQRRGT